MTTRVPLLRLVEDDGAPGRVLPAWLQIELGTDDGTASTVVLTYSALHDSVELLADQAELALFLDGAELDRFILDESSADEVVDDETAVWKGTSRLGLLRYARVYPQSWPGMAIPNHPINATPGWALRDLLERAQQRGALAGVTWDFTDTHDSAGQPWPRNDVETLEIGKTYLEVVEAWHDRRLATAATGAGGVLQLFAYGNQGADRTADVQLLRGRDLLTGPVQSSTRDTVSTMLAVSGELALEADNDTALSRYGRREGFLSQSTVDSTATLEDIAEGTMALTARSRESYEYDLALHGFAPFVDFDRGDIVEVRVRDVDRVMRVRQLAVAWDADGVASGSVAFGDRFASAAQLAQERLEQLTSGSMDTGAYGTPMVNTSSYLDTYVPPETPGEVGRDTIAPAAPANVRVSSRAYLADRGRWGAAVTIAWDPVTSNIDGSSANDLSFYSVQLFRQEPEWHNYFEWQPSGSIPPETTTATLYPLDPNREYRARVRATDWWGNTSGWTELSFVTGQDDVPPAAPPSAPGVAAALFGALRVSWDGLDDTGAVVEDDADHVEVHLSTDAGFTPGEATLRGTIPLPALGQSLDTIVTDLQAGTTYSVRLVLVDVWGNSSAPGPVASGIPASLTADPGDVGPENLTFADYGNLVPDGSFERTEFRTLLAAGRFEETNTPGAPEWSPSSRVGFARDTGNQVLLEADVTDPAAWRVREGPTPIASAEGLVKDAATHARWSTVATVRFDANTLYKVTARVRCDRASTIANSGGLYAAIESKTTSGAWVNGNGADAWTFMQEAAASGRSQSTVGQWRTWTGYVRGTSPIPVGLREGPYNNPAPLPAGTGQFALQTTLDFYQGNGRYTLGSFRVQTPAPAVHGEWSLQFTGGGPTYVRAVLAEIDSPAADVQYYVRFWARLVGPRTPTPTVFAAADMRAADGSTIPTAGTVAKTGGWDHDGWYLIEGRFQRDADAQYSQVDHLRLYVATAGLGSGQTMQVDAVEIRQVATRVMIADAAIDDAKIASLSASKITAGTINAVVTVSGRIATATSGARVELDSSGLKGYNSTGSKTASIEVESGMARFAGVVGNVNVDGYVRALSGAAQITLAPQGMSQDGTIWPGILLSPGVSPIEKAPALIAGTYSTWTKSLVSTFTTPYMRIAGTNIVDAVFLELSLPQTGYGSNASTGDVDQLEGLANLRFPQPTGAIGSGGSAVIENHWTNNRWPVSQGGDFTPGKEISFTGVTSYGHRAGMVIKAANLNDKSGVWIDFRRNAFENTGSTNTFRDNWLWCGIRADTLVYNTAPYRFSDRLGKDRITDIPYSAVEVVRANPAKRWHLAGRRDGEDEPHLGPMSNDLPEEIAGINPENGYTYVRPDDMVGLLWRAVEEITDRLDHLEGES